MTASERERRAEEVYARLFGPRDATAPDPHPELGRILRSVIFGEVFATGDLDDRTRELVTVTVLGALQTLPQLRAHAAAALNVGVTPVELTEAMYQLAPYLGFPRALNAVATLSEVFADRGVELPLPPQGTVTEDDRLTRGRQMQQRLYGDEIADALRGLPGGFDTAVPQFLTGLLFGDFYTRGGLDLATRELLALCALAAAGLSAQLPAHVKGAIEAGNDAERVLAALVQAFPYMGMPAALNAIRALQAHIEQTGQEPAH